MTRRNAGLLVVAAAAGLAGCTQMAPRYERPAAPVPAAFPTAAPAGGTPAADIAWADYFADPALRGPIERALKNNRDLRVAVLNIEAARAQLRLRRADEWPSVNVGASAVRQVGSNGNVTGTYSAGLLVPAWEIDLFGRVRSLSESAAAQLLATEEARKAAQIALVATVAQQQLVVMAGEELLGLTRRTLATREESLRLTRLKFEHGASSELDLHQAQSLVEAAKIALAQFQRQRELDRNALALLIGEPPPDMAAARIESVALADVPAGLPSEVLLLRPDVRQAEQALIAAHADIGAARAAFWPRITLTGSLGTASSHLRDLFKDGAWGYAAQALLPIFDAGRNEANLAAAQVRRDIAQAQYERAVQAAFRDVADALAGRATLGEQLRAARAQAQAEQGRAELVELRFRNGVSSSLELLDAQRSWFAAQQVAVLTVLAALQNRVAVYRALGGGWTQPTP